MPTIKTVIKMTKKEFAHYLIENCDFDGITRFNERKHGTKLCIDLVDVMDKAKGSFSYAIDKYVVEIEEPITALTNLDTLVEVSESGLIHKHYDTSIREEERDSTVEFHTLIDGKLVLIWDREEGLVD
ncbi:hypothetical protein CD117_04185 [Mammaliicoccus sciuri]|uniref:Uncharacterized protein n=1 Tax=Mammaliicoccus sciuri TaxID=1296 RepID=A0AAJ4SIJ2_MAMSC|nr:hypothetical protein [Mammaliicoccus sciuri]RTX73794.1 hypothetical protein CD117_04185 [Mammaliicoccus sciuri]